MTCTGILKDFTASESNFHSRYAGYSGSDVDLHVVGRQVEHTGREDVHEVRIVEPGVHSSQYLPFRLLRITFSKLLETRCVFRRGGQVAERQVRLAQRQAGHLFGRLMGELESDRPTRRVAEHVRLVDAELTQHGRRVSSLSCHVDRAVLLTPISPSIIGNDPELPGSGELLCNPQEEVFRETAMYEQHWNSGAPVVPHH
jgi:hypothetical protein